MPLRGATTKLAIGVSEEQIGPVVGVLDGPERRCEEGKCAISDVPERVKLEKM